MEFIGEPSGASYRIERTLLVGRATMRCRAGGSLQGMAFPGRSLGTRIKKQAGDEKQRLCVDCSHDDPIAAELDHSNLRSFVNE
jgi:hypothetical protein